MVNNKVLDYLSNDTTITKELSRLGNYQIRRALKEIKGNIVVRVPRSKKPGNISLIESRFPPLEISKEGEMCQSSTGVIPVTVT